MGIFDGCLLASDVDGTLVDSGYINPKNLEKIKFFLNEGGMFSLSSGRSACALSPVLRNIEKVSPSVTANGAVIFDFENSKILAQKVLPKEDYRIAKMVEELPKNIAVEIHSGLDVFVTKRTAESDDHERYEEFEVEFTTYEEAAKHTWNKILYACDSLEDREFLKKFIAQKETNCDFFETIAEIYGRTRYYFEQLPKGVSKISALKNLCEISGIKEGRLFAIGDYYNDLPMLKEADISAATAGAPDDIKQCADYVTVACEDGAVADFIDYLTEKFKV